MMSEADVIREIEKGIRAVVPDGCVFEIRIPMRFKKVASGYFDNPEIAAKVVMPYNGKYNIYITLNPVWPALLARAYNRITEDPEHTTTDAHILHREWLLIDLDADRPAGISSSDEEKARARLKAQEIHCYLVDEQGWDRPVIADSGNGYHLLFPRRAENNQEITKQFENILKTLASKFDDGFTKVDCSVFNASRITKLYGTLAVKGDSIPGRTHRYSRIIEEGDLFGF